MVQSVYQASEISSIQNANVDYIVVRINDVSNQPEVYFQDNAVDGPVKFVSLIAGGNSFYAYDNGDTTYNFMSYANVTNVGFYHIDPSFDIWLNSNGSHLFEGLNITLSNGTFSNLYITKKPGSVYTLGTYKNFHPVLDQWTPPSISSYSSYLNGLYEYDIRLLNDSSWYTQQTRDGILNYAVNGIDNPINIVDPPTQGNIYLESELSNIRNPEKDVIGIYVDADVIQLVFQDAEVNVSGNIKLADIGGITGHVLDMGDSNYKYLADYNVEHQNSEAFIHIDKSVAQYMKNNFSHMFSGLNIELYDGIYTNVFVTCRPNLDQNISESMYLNSNDPKYFSIPNTADLSSYMDGIPAYDVKIYKTAEDASWYDQTVQTGIRDYVMTSVAEEPLNTTNPTIVSNPMMNLIYTKSLYESSLAYFDSAITRIEQELQEEQNLANTLTNDDAQLLSDLQTFVTEKSNEVNDKTSHLNQLTIDLQTIVEQNKIAMQSNEELNTFLNTVEAQDLSTKIVELRDSVYLSLKFLTDNHRLGSNNDMVYIVNKVQI